MKVLLVLLLAYIAKCCLTRYYFCEPHENRIEQPGSALPFRLPDGWEQLPERVIWYRPPASLLLYGTAGLLALLVAFGYELYRSLNGAATCVPSNESQASIR